MTMKKRMTTRGLLLVNNFLGRGASYSTSAELAGQLSRGGWKVTCTSSRHNKVLRLADMLFTCIRARGKYDVANVAVFSGSAFLWAELTTALLATLRKPVVLTLHGGNLPQFASRNPGRVRRLLAQANVVTAPSAYLAQRMAPYHNRIEIIPNALDLSLYPFRLREKALPRLVWLRAFHEIYNPMLVPPVMARLKDDFPEVTIRMVGPVKDGSLEKTLRLAEQMDVRDRITVIPGVPKSGVPLELSKGDIFLNTTNIDNQPVSVLEAMACGLCVVSTNVGGLPDLIENGKDGLLCLPGDPEAMAGQINEILKKSRLASRLSMNGRKRLEFIGWEVVLPRWEEMFMRALS